MAQAANQHTPTDWIDLDDVLEYLTLAPFGYEIDRALREMWQRISTGELRLKVETDVLDDKLRVVKGKIRSYKIDPFYFRANYTLEFGNRGFGGQRVNVIHRGGFEIGRRDYTVAEQDVRRIWPPRPPAQQNKLGAPLEHDWDDYEQKFQQLWQEKGDFQLPQNQIKGWNSQAAAAGTLLDYIQTCCGDGEEPHQKTVEGYIARWAKRLRGDGA